MLARVSFWSWILYQKGRTGSFHCRNQQCGKWWEPITVSMMDVIGSEHLSSTHINSHACNSNPFLHDLQPDNKLYATASVQFATANTKQHGEISV